MEGTISFWQQSVKENIGTPQIWLKVWYGVDYGHATEEGRGRKERVSQGNIVTSAYALVVKRTGCPVNEIRSFSWVPTEYYQVIQRCGSQDTVVGIGTGYGLDDRGVGVRVPVGVKNFLFFTSSRPALGSTQSRIQWVPGVLYPGIKRTGREADHSPPTSAETKKMWIYTSNPP
jgi:hypothetical protein